MQSSQLLFLMAAAVVSAPHLRNDVINRVAPSGPVLTVERPVARQAGVSASPDLKPRIVPDVN